MNLTQATPPTVSRRGVRRRWLYAVLILAFLFVLMPYLFWQATWFGRPLSDAQITKDLADRKHPRETQHALSQIADRILSSNPQTRASARQWYPQVVAVGISPADELRLTAAWVMGQDNTAQEFHRALLGLVNDSNPMVRRNAALSLVRFGDTSGKDIIVAMLEPYTLEAPAEGVLQQRLKPGDTINPGTLVGRIEHQGQTREIRSKVPGTLAQWIAVDGEGVDAGQAVARLAPSEQMVWEALRALYIIGEPGDLAQVAPYVRGAFDMTPKIREQAQLTVEAIRQRSANQ